MSTAWRLPDKHGELYYYQKLLLNVPWRQCRPESFITATNLRGSLAEQCRISTRPDGQSILPDGDEAEIARYESEKRHFNPGQVASIVERAGHFCDVAKELERLITGYDPGDERPDSGGGAGGGGGGDNGSGSAGGGGGADGDGAPAAAPADALQMQRMVDEISQARGAPKITPAPQLESLGGGGLRWTTPQSDVYDLKNKQIEAYELLKQARHEAAARLPEW